MMNDMAKKPSTDDDMGLKSFIAVLDDEYRDRDLVSDDPLEAPGEGEAGAGSPGGDADGDPSGVAVGGRRGGGSAAKGRRRKSAAPGGVADVAYGSIRLNGRSAGRIVMVLTLLKAAGVKGSKTDIVWRYLEEGLRRDHPDVLEAADVAMRLMDGGGKKQ